MCHKTQQTKPNLQSIIISSYNHLQVIMLFFSLITQKHIIVFEIKYSYLTQIICTELDGFKYSSLILIIIWFQVVISIWLLSFVCAQLYGFKSIIILFFLLITQKHIIVCKLLVLRIVTWRFHCLKMIINNYLNSFNHLQRKCPWCTRYQYKKWTQMC